MKYPKPEKCLHCDNGHYRREIFVPERNKEVCFVHVLLCEECGEFGEFETRDCVGKIINTFGSVKLVRDRVEKNRV